MFKKMLYGLIVLGSIGVGLSSAQEEEVQETPSRLTQLPQMSMETALEIAQGTLDACRRQGVQVAVTVVNREGSPQVILRDTLAPALAIKISQQKAYTAASFTAPTSNLMERREVLGEVEGLLFAVGGLPIQAGGVLVGGVGVSGAPAGETDEACAQAGIDKVQEDLNFAEF